MSDRPASILSEQGSGDRPQAVLFSRPPEPIFTQRYGENPRFPLQRCVDIGSKHLSLIEENISALKGIQGIAIGEIGMTGAVLNVQDVQKVRFGPPRKTTGQGVHSKAFRGYVMIEPENLFDAIQRINHIGKLRLQEGKHLEYNWVQPMVRNAIFDRIKGLGGRNNEALYPSGLMDQLITFYADTAEEIPEIFEQLVTQTQWQKIENQKRFICSSIDITRPLHGQRRFIHAGQEFFTLELKDQPEDFHATQKVNGIEPAPPRFHYPK